MPDYRDAWRRRDEAEASRFHLWRLEDPNLGIDGRPIWRSESFSSVLSADARNEGNEDMFDLAPLIHLATVHVADGREHLLLSNGVHDLRLDIMSGSVRRGPAELRWRLQGLQSLKQKLEPLEDLIAAVRSGSMPVKKPLGRARRWANALRVHDALAAGAGQRDIAARLFSQDVHISGWRESMPEMRLRAQRLVSIVRAAETGRWEEFLHFME